MSLPPPPRLSDSATLLVFALPFLTIPLVRLIKRLEQRYPRVFGPAPLREESSIDDQGFSTDWMNFYIYALMPFRVLHHVWMIGASLYMAYRIADFAFPVFTVFTLSLDTVVLIALVPMTIGLMRRRHWGWLGNMILLILQPLGFPVYLRARGTLAMPLSFRDLVFVLLFSVVWTVPNVIYFAKRRVLFTSATISGAAVAVQETDQ